MCSIDNYAERRARGESENKSQKDSAGEEQIDLGIALFWMKMIRETLAVNQGLARQSAFATPKSLCASKLKQLTTTFLMSIRAVCNNNEALRPWQPQGIMTVCTTSLHQMMYRMISLVLQGVVSQLVAPFLASIHLQMEHIHIGVTSLNASVLRVVKFVALAI